MKFMQVTFRVNVYRTVFLITANITVATKTVGSWEIHLIRKCYLHADTELDRETSRRQSSSGGAVSSSEGRTGTFVWGTGEWQSDCRGGQPNRAQIATALLRETG